MKKVFFLGFNKTATVSFHYLFALSGYKSAHNIYRIKGKPETLALRMFRNKSFDLPILNGISDYEVFSDLIFVKPKEKLYIEANKWYRELHKEYPDSYFILQTRNVNDWLNSRENHDDGNFLKRCMKLKSIMNHSEMLEHWKNERLSREEEIKQYFKGNKDFLLFDIDKDPIDKLIEHVRPEFNLKKMYWYKLNVTTDKQYK